MEGGNYLKRYPFVENFFPPMPEFFPVCSFASRPHVPTFRQVTGDLRLQIEDLRLEAGGSGALKFPNLQSKIYNLQSQDWTYS